MTPRESQLPRRIKIGKVLSSRYPSGKRPHSWDERHAGLEEVQTDDGELVVLYSNGGQSSPEAGWELLLTRPYRSNDSNQALEWTLYGISKLEA